MAKEGSILPKCPSCNMFLHLETEALAGMCFNCEDYMKFEEITWISSCNFPKA